MAPLFGLLLERQGASGFVIGLNQMAAALMIVASSPFLPPVMARVGLVPLMLMAVAAMVVSILVIPVFENVIWWTALRLVTGAATTALFYGSEYWMIAAAPEC